MTALSSTRYVSRDRHILDGEPIIIGTQIPVRDLVSLWKNNIRPEDIPDMLYNLVSKAQVFDALSFYFDNTEEIDQYINHYQELGAMSCEAILLSHNPFWDDLEVNIRSDRQILDTAMEENTSASFLVRVN